MKLFLFTLTLFATMLTSIEATAIPFRQNRDFKLPTQQMVEKQSFTNPAAAGTTDVLSAALGSVSALASVVSTFVAQPDVARNLVITPVGTTGDVEACTVVVAGLDYSGSSISENFAFLANASTATTGAKAFSSVTSITWPADCESGAFGANWSVGYGEKLGVNHCLAAAGHIFFSTLNGAKEATAPTMVISASAKESNTADFNGTMNGSNDFELFYIQNFACP